MTNQTDNLQAISDFLGSERLDDLKDFVISALKDNLEESINERWVVVPETFSEMWEELLEECMKEIKKKYKKQIIASMSAKVEEYIESLKDS